MLDKRKLQVFTSSTYIDLIDERQAAVAAVLKAGHIPAGMELFTAGDQSQMQTIERWIDESDVYMLILGGRYGSIEPTSNRSYTELEYDYARRQGKPTFAVVIDEHALDRKVQEVGRKCLETEAPHALKAFREKVLSNVSSFFSDAKDIRLCVHESLADFAANPALKGWVSATSVTDHRALLDEISRLKETNDELERRLQFASISPGGVVPGKFTYDDLVLVLTETIIEVDADLTNTKEKGKLSLLDVSNQLLGHLLTGVTNSISSSSSVDFLYYKLLPQLQIFGLAENEAVPGVQWRRSALNEAGRQFFAQYRREQLNNLPRSASSASE